MLKELKDKLKKVKKNDIWTKQKYQWRDRKTYKETKKRNSGAVKYNNRN